MLGQVEVAKPKAPLKEQKAVVHHGSSCMKVGEAWWMVSRDLSMLIIMWLLTKLNYACYNQPFMILHTWWMQNSLTSCWRWLLGVFLDTVLDSKSEVKMSFSGHDHVVPSCRCCSCRFSCSAPNFCNTTQLPLADFTCSCAWSKPSYRFIVFAKIMKTDSALFGVLVSMISGSEPQPST